MSARREEVKHGEPATPDAAQRIANEIAPETTKATRQELMGQLMDRILQALVNDFWRTCETFAIRLFLYLLLLVTLYNIWTRHS